MKYISRMPEERRLAILTAFVKAQEISALDEAVDVLDMLILNITREAKTGQKKRLRTLRILTARRCCWRGHAHLLDEDTADDLLRKTIFSSVSVARLAESVEKVNELARPDTNFQDEMVEQYGRVRRFARTTARSALPCGPRR